MLPMIDREWISHVKNVFLIRNPREMLTSLVHQIPNPTLKETGLPQQLTLFTELQQQGVSSIVIDSKNILQNQESSLSVLCKELGVPFLAQMLQWPAGKRASDGVWAPHWYTSVESSTGFAPWSPKEERVPPTLESLCLECEDIYNELASHNMIV